MAKKFGKFLLFTAAIGAAGAAAYYYMQKKDAALMAESDEDYDDFSEDADEKDTSRTYVPLPHDGTGSSENAAAADTAPAQEAPSAKAPSEEDLFTPLSEQAAQTAETAGGEMEETVEEFFDDGDSVTG